MRKAIETANTVFGMKNVAEITLLKKDGPAEVMALNAAGLLEAVRLNAIHCYKVGSPVEIQELLAQVRLLELPQGMSARQVFAAACQFAEMLPVRWENEVWQSWADNWLRWKLPPMETEALGVKGAQRFCGRRFRLEHNCSGWALWRRTDKKETDDDGSREALWRGTMLGAAFYQELLKYRPEIRAFIYL